MVEFFMHGFFGFNCVLSVASLEKFSFSDSEKISDVLNKSKLDNFLYNNGHKSMVNMDMNSNYIENLRHVCWIYVRDSGFKSSQHDDLKVGKWMLFVNVKDIDYCWDKLVTGIEQGFYKSFKISVPDDMFKDKYDMNEIAIMIYTDDYDNVNDVKSVLNYIIKSELISKNKSSEIYYKADYMTKNNCYSGGRFEDWLYVSSDFIGGE